MENNENLNMVELNEESLEEVSGGKGGKSAGQKVKATGNVHIRKKPNLKGDDMGSIVAGSTLTFLGERKTDNRGVAWYKVSFNGKTGWVSSKYSKVV